MIKETEELENYDIFNVKKEFILILYLMLAFTESVSPLLDLEFLQLMIKPVMLPLLAYYYFDRVKKSVSVLVILIYLFFYIGEVLSLINPLYFEDIVLVVSLVPYFLLGIYLIKSASIVNFRERKLALVLLLLLFALLIYLAYLILSTIEYKSNFELIVFINYAAFLLFLVLIAASKFLNSTNVYDFHLLLAVINMIVSDIFYVFYNNIEFEISLLSINLISQSLSYYFLTKYFVSKEKSIKNTEYV